MANEHTCMPDVQVIKRINTQFQIFVGFYNFGARNNDDAHIKLQIQNKQKLRKVYRLCAGLMTLMLIFVTWASVKSVGMGATHIT